MMSGGSSTKKLKRSVAPPGTDLFSFWKRSCTEKDRLPVMPCLSGQFFDVVRSQCISCIDVCPPNGIQDKYCGNHCPQMPGTAEVIGPKDVPTSFSFNILLATVVPIIALVVIICFGIWMKRRRDQGAVSNVDQNVSIEMQPVGHLLPNGEPESNTDEKIRLGGEPEENADHTATRLLPNEAIDKVY